MCFLEHVTDLCRDLYSTWGREATLASEGLRESFSLDKLHNDELSSIRETSGVENHRCMRMTEFGHRSCFAQETFCDIVVGCEFSLDDFDGDGAIKPEMSSEINGSH